MDLSEAQAQEYFQNAESNLKETSTILSGIIESQYNLQDIETLCNEFDRLFPPVADEVSITQKIRKFLPLVIAYKQIVLADEDATVLKEKWTDLLKSAADAYSRGLYAVYFLKDANLFYSVGLHSLDKIREENKRILGRADSETSRRWTKHSIF